jgi:putative membrane-bound dehydrogenase-like protein
VVAVSSDKVARLSFKELQVGDEPTPRSQAEALASFQLPPGFKIELVAGEPLVVDPVAFDWGPDGKLWVVEMRDYPLGMDGKGQPGGVVKFLESTRGDGHYDKATVFLEGLNFPDGIMPWRNGVLISAAPDIIYAEDTDGDGRADVKTVLFTGFRQGNQQHRINGFEYGLDNWVYCANGQSGGVIRSTATGEQLDIRGHDLRINPDLGLLELQPGATQFGRHKDDWGNWFGNDNSHWAWHYFLPEHYLARNPHLAAGGTSRLLAAYEGANRIFGISKVQQRYNWPDSVLEVTSACSAAPYRDVLFGPEFENSLFVCDPANNVVHREVLEQDGVSFTSHRAPGELSREFLPSTDNWCRPVTVKTGPDGALYVADMYRLVIEHPEYFPAELRQRPDMRAGEDKGRIYRVFPEGARLRPVPRLDKLGARQLVQALDSPNGWQRDTVQRLIVLNHLSAATKDLERLTEKAANPKVRLQALATLDGLQTLSAGVLERALRDSNYAVRRYAIALSEPRLRESPPLASRVFSLADDGDERVRYQLAFSLGEFRDARSGPTLARIAIKDWGDPTMRTAVLSSATGHVGEVLTLAMNRASHVTPPAGLIEKFVGLAASMSLDAVLAQALNEIGKPAGRNYAEWQVAGVAGLLDALQRRDLSLAEFQKQAEPSTRDAILQLDGLFSQARGVATNPAAAEPDRLLAIRLLRRGISGQDQDTKLLGELLGPQSSPAIQSAALAGLRRGASAGVAETLLAHWRAAGSNLRQEILNALFSRQEWTESVITALEQGRLSSAELGAVQRQKLLASAPAIRERAAKLLEGIAADRTQIVLKYKNVADLSGDRERGHLLFTQNCSICHQLKGEGQRIGPDLGTVADKPVSELVVAILDPNQAVDPAYTSYTAVTGDGRELSGILVAETPNSITLRMAGGGEEQLLRSNLKEFTGSGRSLMPEGFENAFKPQDLADVIAYVLRP